MKVITNSNPKKMKRIHKLFVVGAFCHLALASNAQISSDESGIVAIRNEMKSDYNLTGFYAPVKPYDNSDNNKIVLNWTASSNETISSFEVQRSFDGADFTIAGLVFGTENTGKETFTFYETIKNHNKVYYRLKTNTKDETANYSKILVFQTQTDNIDKIKVISNPVTDKLSFGFKSDDNQPFVVKISDLKGSTQMNVELHGNQGFNLVTLPPTSAFKSGMYIIELMKGTERFISKFVKL